MVRQCTLMHGNGTLIVWKYKIKTTFKVSIKKHLIEGQNTSLVRIFLFGRKFFRPKTFLVENIFGRSLRRRLSTPYSFFKFFSKKINSLNLFKHIFPKHFSNFQASFNWFLGGKLWEAPSRLYRSRFLRRESTCSKALDEIYKIYKLLHRFEFKNSATFRQTYSHFLQFRSVTFLQMLSKMNQI